jgi:hypothetical protein
LVVDELYKYDIGKEIERTVGLAGCPGEWSDDRPTRRIPSLLLS